MSNDINDLQNLDLSTVPTALPVLVDGQYEATVADAKVEPNSKGDGNNFNVKLTLNLPAKGVIQTPNGLQETQLNAGFPVFDTISMKETRKDDGSLKYDPRINLAKFQEGVLGTKGAFFPLEQYIGRRVLIKTKIEKNAEYGDRARVVKYTYVS
jgi:hypothetical protein